MKRQRGSLSATTHDNATPARPGSVPAMVGRFLIEELIGRGGMSDVYRAFDPQLNRDVALKVLAPALGRNSEFTNRFIRESRAAAQLTHPHVVPIFEAGNDGDTLFIAMQLVRGVDLKTHIERTGPLPYDQIRTVMSQAAEALDHAHAKGLLHRDVKPANLLLEVRGETLHVYLTDFGLTRSLGTDSRITHTGELVGSVHYVSPEHLEGRELDTRSDIYSLGCVLHECLVARPPFERDTDMAVLWAHINAETPRPSRARRGLPNVVDRVVARSLAKDPAHRYDNCNQLAASLDAALQGVAVDLPAPTSAVKRPGRDRFKGVLGIAVAAALFTSSVVVATKDWTPDRPSPTRTTDSAEHSQETQNRSSAERLSDRLAGTGVASREERSSGEVRESDGTQSTGFGSLAAPGPLGQGSQDDVIGALDWTRSERENYDFRSGDLGVGEPCPTDGTSAAGCMEFDLEADERFLDVVITDQSGFDVGAFIRQDYDADPYWDGPAKPFCNQTEAPVEVKPGARVQVWIDPQGCSGESSPWVGVIVARLFKAQR